MEKGGMKMPAQCSTTSSHHIYQMYDDDEYSKAACCVTKLVFRNPQHVSNSALVKTQHQCVVIEFVSAAAKDKAKEAKVAIHA